MSLDAEKKQTLLEAISISSVEEAFGKNGNFQNGSPGLQVLVLEELSKQGFDRKNDQVWQMHNGRLEPVSDGNNLAALLLEGNVLVFSDKEGDMRCMTADSCNGRFYLQSMTAEEAEKLRDKQDELAKDWNLKKPTILDKIVDFFARIFGSRDKVCEEWDAVYTTKLKESIEYADQYQTQKRQEIQKRAQQIEQNLGKMFFKDDINALEDGIQKQEKRSYHDVKDRKLIWDKQNYTLRMSRQEDFYNGELNLPDNEETLSDDVKHVFHLLPFFYKAEKNGFDEKIGEKAVDAYIIKSGYGDVWNKIREGELTLEEYDTAVKGMEHTLISLDPSSPKAHMLGNILEFASSSYCRAYIDGSDLKRGRSTSAPERYELSEDAKFIRKLQKQVRAASEEMRILADKENYKRYPEAVKKSLAEVSKAMLAQKLLKGIGELKLSERKDLAYRFEKKYELGLKTMEKHVKEGNFAENIETVIGGLNGKILDSIETKTKEAEKKSASVEMDTISRQSIPVMAKDDVILPS